MIIVQREVGKTDYSVSEQKAKKAKYPSVVGNKSTCITTADMQLYVQRGTLIKHLSNSTI